MRVTRSNSRGIAAGVGLVVLLVAACSDGSGEGDTVAANAAQADGGGWGVFARQAEEVEGFAALAEMGMIPMRS